MRADIVIVNWNSGAMLADCIASIAEGDVSRIGRVIVVDNGSVDGSEKVRCPGIDLIVDLAGRNLGFGAACNRGAAQGRSDLVLFINPDVEVAPEAISRTVEAMGQEPNHDVGVMGIRLIDRHGVPQAHCARFPKLRHFLAESTGLSHLFPRYFKPIRLLEFDHLQSRDVDHVIGAFYCIRRSLFEQLGGFDEEFFVYYEDLDLSRRVASAGWRVRFLAEPSAFHHEGGTSRKILARRLFLAIQGRLLYAKKHRSRSEFVLIQLIALLIEPVTRSLYALSRGRWSEFRETVTGYSLLFSHIFRAKLDS